MIFINLIYKKIIIHKLLYTISPTFIGLNDTLPTIPLESVTPNFQLPKLYTKVDFPQRRVQTFIPANGTPSINKVTSELKSFIDECFIDGQHNKLYNYKKIATTKNCKWCEFRDKPDLCDRKN